MNLNIENIVRSVVVLVVGLPLTLSLNNLVSTTARLADAAGEKSKEEVVTEQIKASLVEPCIRWVVSKEDSKLERQAKNDIDDVLGGDVNHRETCNWVL